MKKVDKRIEWNEINKKGVCKRKKEQEEEIEKRDRPKKGE